MFELEYTYPSLKVVRTSGTTSITYRRANPEDIKTYLQDAIRNNGKVKKFIFASHGNVDAMYFYKYPWSDAAETFEANMAFQIAITDAKGQVSEDLTQLFQTALTDDADVHLEGCNAAEGDTNMAKRMSKVLPGRKVHSYTGRAEYYTYFDSLSIFGSSRTYKESQIVK